MLTLPNSSAELKSEIAAYSRLKLPKLAERMEDCGQAGGERGLSPSHSPASLKTQ